MGESVGDVELPDSAADALAELQEVDPGTAITVDEIDDAVLYGWVDDEGFLVRTDRVETWNGEDWTASQTTKCWDPEEAATAAEEKFETVGEAIDE